MKTTILPLKHSINRSRCPLALLLIPLALACFALSPQARASGSVLHTAGVQLLPLQFGQIAVSNITAGSVSTTINILNADGSVFMTRTSQVAPQQTFLFPFQNEGTTSVYSAVVTSSVRSSIVSDFQVLLPNNEVGAVFFGVAGTDEFLRTPSAQLIPGQAALATVTNITTSGEFFSITVLDGNAIVILSTSALLNPGQTLSYSFSNTGTANNTYRAVILGDVSNGLTADVMFFDKTTGQIGAVLQGNTASAPR